MITLELPDGTKRPTPITDIDSIRVARGGTDLPELARLGVIVTYTDGTFDAVVGTFTELCAAIAAATPKARAPADVLTDPQPGDRVQWSDGEAWRVLALDSGCVIYLDSIGRPHRMSLPLWRKSDPNMIGIPRGLASDAQPPTT